MAIVHLSKYHGLGNDFLVVLGGEVPADAPDLARRLCRRTRGVGADGLIFGVDLADVGGGPGVAMNLFNSDGSAAEISGNGIRCLAHAVQRRDGGDVVRIRVAGDDRTLRVASTDDPDTVMVEVDMGAVGAGPDVPDDLPIGDLGVGRAGTGDVGNPHLVLAVEGPIDPAVEGPRLEAPFLPTGINVHFLTVTGPDRIGLVHWERGAGVTEACGSGATVSATLAHRWGLVGSQVTVEMPGGTARVTIGDRATLLGPSTFVFSAEVTHG